MSDKNIIQGVTTNKDFPPLQEREEIYRVARFVSQRSLSTDRNHMDYQNYSDKWGIRDFSQAISKATSEDKYTLGLPNNHFYQLSAVFIFYTADSTEAYDLAVAIRDDSLTQDQRANVHQVSVNSPKLQIIK